MALTLKNHLRYYINQMGSIMDKDLELAIDNPQEFLSKPQPSREWDMAAEDIARSINYNPYTTLATKAMKEPEKYNWVESVLRGIGSSIESIGINAAQSTNDMLGMYYSPNMTQEQADRLTEDVVYAQNFAYKARQAEDVPYAKDHEISYDFAQGIGSFIDFALSEAINPIYSMYLMFASSRGQMQEQLADKYIEETGDIRGYAQKKKTEDILSTGFGVLNSAIERLGMEKLLGRIIRNPAKYGKLNFFNAARATLAREALKRTGKQFVSGFIREGAEEVAQSYLEDATQISAGYGTWSDLLSKESLRKALKSGWYGGIIGGAAGATMFNVSRMRIKQDIAKWSEEHKLNLTDLQVTQATDTLLNNGQEALLSEITTRAELKTRSGKAFEILVDKIKQQIAGTGTPFPTDQDLDAYARTVAKTIQIPTQNLSLWTDIPIEWYLNAAQIRVTNGMWELAPIQSSEDVKTLIDTQKAVIKEQNKLKKLGTEDANVLDRAKQRKNELQVIYDNLVAQEAIDNERIALKKEELGWTKEQDAVPAKESKYLENSADMVAFGDKIPEADRLNTMTDGKWNMPELRNRYKNAFMSWLTNNNQKAFDKLAFDTELPEKIIDPIIANGGAIVDLQTKYPEINIKEDIYRALKKYPRTNAENFTTVMQEVELNGRDVLPENVILWNFIFSDNTTIKMFFDNYVKIAMNNRDAVKAGENMVGEKVAPLSKKDLYAQALKQTDEMRSQISAENGKEYEPLFTETGEITDVNLQSAFISYQNQFNTPGRLFQNMPVKNLVATHAARKAGVEQALKIGGFAMPSLAIKKDLDSNYGEIVFVAPASMAQPSRATRVYDRDAWTPMVNFIEYKSNDWLYGHVKAILENNDIDTNEASSFIYNIEEGMKEGEPTWNEKALELFFIKEGIRVRADMDVNEMRRMVLDSDSDLRNKYYKWYNEVIVNNTTPRIFKGFTKVRGDRRYVPATLDNIVAELKTQPEHRDFSWQDVYDFYDVMRETVTRFKDVKSIKKATDRLKDPQEIQMAVFELNSEFNRLASELNKDPNNLNSQFSLGLAIIDGTGSLAERLEQVNLKNDPESVKKVEDLIAKIKQIPVRYFEGKPRRAVRFNEFSAAFVPSKESYNEIAEQLTEQGVNVLRYGSIEERDELFNNLVLTNEDIMFQGNKMPNAWYDPELQIIALTKKWNNLSLVHELHHHYLSKLIDVYNQAKAGIIKISDSGMAEIRNLFDLLDIKDPMQLTEEQLKVAQERFAAMTEAYLTGLGVQEPQNQAYKDFLNWIPEKYKSFLNIGYLNEKNEIVNPLLDQDAIDFFNKWFSQPQMPALPTSPDAQSFVNPMDDKDEIIPSSQKEMNDREIKWGIDSAEQIEADKKLYNMIDEDTPNDLRAAIDGAKVELKNQPVEDTISMPEIQRKRWFMPGVKNAQERMAEMAKEYVAKNTDHAIELALADPEISTIYDAPIDRAWLIRAVMDITDKGSPEYAVMYDNLATYRSMSGSTLGLTNDISQQAYLEAKREIENSRELKAVINYAGNNRGAWDKWSGDIKAFINARVGKVLATEAGTPERKVALQAFIEEAKTKFSGNTEDIIFNQLDLTGVNARSKAVFVKWAEKAIKQAAGVGLTNEQQKKLMDVSVKAQQAMLAIDNPDSAISASAGRDLRKWQILKDELKKANLGRFDKFNNAMNNLFGGYIPSALLMSFNTLFVANIPSTAINNAIIKSSAQKIFGEQLVKKSVLDAEEKRIREVYRATGMNLAQMERPTSPSLMHGEKYMGQEKSKWYDFTFKVLSWGDNLFRIPTFVDTLGRIASKNANGDAKLAEEKFRQYCQLNTTDEEAKLSRKQALAVSNMAVFTQDGILASQLNRVRDAINKMSRGLLGLESEGFGLGNLLAPFLKTGANVVEMGVTGSIAPIRQIATWLKQLNGKEIPELQKIALRSDWKVFALTALSVALLSGLTGDDDDLYIEPYELGKPYDPERPYDSINIAGVWVKLDTFGVFSGPIRVAVKLIKDKNVFSAYGFGLQEAIGETPLLNNLTTDPTYMFKQPEKWAEGFGYTQANKFVPSQAKSLTRAGSRALGIEYPADWLGTYLQRRFHRNYGLDGTQPTMNDYINILTNRLKIIE